MKLSIVIPVYNEVATIQEIVKRVLTVKLNYDKEIIIVDDGSTDGTKEILQEKLKSSVAKVIHHAQNEGKGASLRSGFKAVTGDIVIIQDADLEYDPACYQKIIRPIEQDKADVVYGSRFVGSEEHHVLYFWHRVANGILTTLSNMLTNRNLTDIETGYKAFRRSVVDRLTIEENRFGVEPEITAKVAKMGCRMYEVGISYWGRTYEEGKKIGWKDGVHALWCILKYNLWSRQKHNEHDSRHTA